MKTRETLEDLLDSFGDGSGFGDPDARRNAELRLQVHLAKEQQRIAARLNHLTLLLVVVGILNTAVLAVQLLRR